MSFKVTWGDVGGNEDIENSSLIVVCNGSTQTIVLDSGYITHRTSTRTFTAGGLNFSAYMSYASADDGNNNISKPRLHLTVSSYGYSKTVPLVAFTSNSYWDWSSSGSTETVNISVFSDGVVFII